MILTLLFGSDTKAERGNYPKAKPVYPSLLFVRLTVPLALSMLVIGCTQSQNTVETALSPQASQSASQSVTPPSNTGQVEANSLAENPQTSTADTVTQAPLATSEAEQNRQVAALDNSRSLTIVEIEGAPTSAVTELTKSLRDAASERGLTLVPRNQTGAKYQVKGYFSALNDGSGTLVVYVWDVLDQNGKRVHRINGQERSGDSKPNPWLAITGAELSRVSNRTTDSLRAWIDSSRG